VPIIETPPPSRGALAAHRLARFAARFGITLPFGQVHPVEELPTPVRENWRALQWGEWEANVYDNFCPACKQMTLIFDAASLVMLD
jgi:2-hydroxychromene-2-carboxylate isomerase